MPITRMPAALWIVIIFALVVTSIPSFTGMLSAPPGGSWTGILTRNTADVNGYLSMIEEAREGHWRMRNLFTAEPHSPFQVRPLWLLLGFTGRLLPQISNVTLMEMARVITASCLLLIIAAIVRLLFKTSRDQTIAFLVMAFGSGIGWAHLVADPPDLRIVETSTYLTLVSPPLYTLSLTLVLAILLSLQRSCDARKGFLYSFLAGLCALWLGFDRPFSLAPLAFAVAGFLVVELIVQKRIPSEQIVRTLPLLVGALIPVLYQYFAIQTVPVYADWNQQHVLRTPEWPRLLSSLGLLLPLAIVGLKPAFRENRPFATLTLLYISGSLLFSHLPIGFQERFLEGLPVLTALFAAFGLFRLSARIRKPELNTLVVTAVLVTLSLSHFEPLKNDLAAIARQAPPQYMPDKILQAMGRLKTLASKEEAILSSEASGIFLIAYAGRPVVLAQRIQTADYGGKRRLVSQFFSTPADQNLSRELFLKSHAKWLFWGPEEAWISLGRFHPAKAPYLQEQYNDGFIRLFKLK